MNEHACRPSPAARGHTFDSTSGWCVHGCGVRDDGLVITRDGRPIIRPRTAPMTSPTPPPDALDFTQPRRTTDT